jgi:hypothetical protein
LPAQVFLDCCHLRARCTEEASRAWRGRAAKAPFLRRLWRRHWCGDVEGAVRVIGEELPRARPGTSLATFGEYLERWRACRYIGSGHVEKANDVLVARRQKGTGMHWSGETSDALAALCTLKQNQEWERYWQQPQGQPALLSAAA